VITQTKQLLNDLNFCGNTVYIVTGRSNLVHYETLVWLHQNKIRFDHLIMRIDGDHRPDHEIKREWLYQFKKENPEEVIMGVFEDRQGVVDMWRSEGLICYQVAPGNF